MLKPINSMVIVKVIMVQVIVKVITQVIVKIITLVIVIVIIIVKVKEDSKFKFSLLLLVVQLPPMNFNGQFEFLHSQVVHRFQLTWLIFFYLVTVTVIKLKLTLFLFLILFLIEHSCVDATFSL